MCAQTSSARRVAKDTCPRPAIGGAVPEPEDLRSHDGVLKVELTVRNAIQADGSTRYCYMDAHGAESPNLRLHPGDLLILTLKNDLVDPHAGDAAGGDHMQMQMHGDAAHRSRPTLVRPARLPRKEIANRSSQVMVSESTDSPTAMPASC